jgi:hypothetical protein
MPMTLTLPFSQMREALTRRRERRDAATLIKEQEAKKELAALRVQMDRLAEKMDEADLVVGKQLAVDRLYQAARRDRKAARRASRRRYRTIAASTG